MIDRISREKNWKLLLVCVFPVRAENLETPKISWGNRVVRLSWSLCCDVEVAKRLKFWQGCSNNRGNTRGWGLEGAVQTGIIRDHKTRGAPRNLGASDFPTLNHILSSWNGMRQQATTRHDMHRLHPTKTDDDLTMNATMKTKEMMMLNNVTTRGDQTMGPPGRTERLRHRP